jgi:hypothetical protein
MRRLNRLLPLVAAATFVILGETLAPTRASADTITGVTSTTGARPKAIPVPKEISRATPTTI